MRLYRPALIAGLLMLMAAAIGGTPQSDKLDKQQDVATGAVQPKTVSTRPSLLGTRGNPLVIESVPGVSESKERALEARHLAREERSGRITLIVAILMAVISSIQVALFVWQLRLMRQTAADAGAAAKAAELSARAAVGIELPLVRAVPQELLGTDELISGKGPYGGSVLSGPPERYNAIGLIEFRNDGRTPAFLERISIGWKVARTLPDAPLYSHFDRLRHNALIRPGDTYTLDMHYGIELADDELRATASHEEWLWFYGALEYRDFLDEVRVARFCWRFSDLNEGTGPSRFYAFQSDGNPPAAYTSRA